MIYLGSQTLVVGGEPCLSGPRGPSMSLHVPDGCYTVLGNITSGQILVPSAPLGPPWAPLNVQGAP